MSSPQKTFRSEAPVYVKRQPDQWSDDDAFFYLLADGGRARAEATLFRCRNHPWFKSCVPVDDMPGLAIQRASLQVHWPRIPYRLTELTLGFFARVLDLYDTESLLLLCYNRNKKRYQLICPEQRVDFGSVRYDVPNLAPELALVGDLHSHPGDDPEPSLVDKWDERNRAMLHIIWAFPRRRRPTVHVDAVIDGYRFGVNPDLILEPGYRRMRLKVPDRWLDRVHVATWKYNGAGSKTQYPTGCGTGRDGGNGGGAPSYDADPTKPKPAPYGGATPRPPDPEVPR